MMMHVPQILSVNYFFRLENEFLCESDFNVAVGAG